MIFRVALGASLSPLVATQLTSSPLWITQLTLVNFAMKLAASALVVLVIDYSLHRKDYFKIQVVYRALFLGCIITLGLHLTGHDNEPWWQPLGSYLTILAIFHLSEFLSIALINPKEAKLDGFLLNHSREYHFAFLISMAEFALTSYFFSNVKYSTLSWWIFQLGLVLCIGGEVLRKLAIFTAGSNFDHIIQTERSDGHKLVTSGVYALCRHPSYVGWFFWSIGTQLVLLNPFSLLGYTYFSWHFFHERIRYEEATLLRFFGKQYEQYKRRVPSGLPFIRGFHLPSL